MPIEVNGRLITDPIEKADKYAKHIQNISQTGKQISIYDLKKDLQQACDKGEDEGYNQNITLEELLFAIRSAKNSSPGLDQVTAILIKNLPDNMILELLDIINESYNTGYVPDSFKIGIIVPILKPGKSDKEISYRPITLLTCISKIDSENCSKAVKVCR